jgi:hypothetical protein
VLAQGSVACPTGSYYAVPHVFYSGAQDMRSCSSCMCDTPTGVDCNANAHVSLWSTGGCDAGMSQTITGLPATCASPGFKILGGTFTTTPSGGSCVATGGTPMGAVAPEGPVTICCTQ